MTASSVVGTISNPPSLQLLSSVYSPRTSFCHVGPVHCSPSIVCTSFPYAPIFSPTPTTITGIPDPLFPVEPSIDSSMRDCYNPSSLSHIPQGMIVQLVLLHYLCTPKLPVVDNPTSLKPFSRLDWMCLKGDNNPLIRSLEH